MPASQTISHIRRVAQSAAATTQVISVVTTKTTIVDSRSAVVLGNTVPVGFFDALHQTVAAGSTHSAVFDHLSDFRGRTGSLDYAVAVAGAGAIVGLHEAWVLDGPGGGDLRI